MVRAVRLVSYSIGRAADVLSGTAALVRILESGFIPEVSATGIPIVPLTGNPGSGERIEDVCSIEIIVINQNIRAGVRISLYENSSSHSNSTEAVSSNSDIARTV